MSGDVPLFQSCIAAVERLATRIPELATSLGTRWWPGAIVVAIAGLVLLAVGSRLAPVLAGAAGGLIGWLAGTQLYALAGGGFLPVSTVGGASAVVLGLASLLAPVIYVMVLGAAVGTLLGLRLSLGGGGWVGAAAGAAIFATIAALLRRLLLAATAAGAGAFLCVVALIALAVPFPRLGALTHRPILLVGLGAFLAVVGTAFQAGYQSGAKANAAPREKRARMVARG